MCYVLNINCETLFRILYIFDDILNTLFYDINLMAKTLFNFKYLQNTKLTSFYVFVIILYLKYK